jgi:hypothetical protein
MKKIFPFSTNFPFLPTTNMADSYAEQEARISRALEDYTSGKNQNLSALAREYRIYYPRDRAANPPILELITPSASYPLQYPRKRGQRVQIDVQYHYRFGPFPLVSPISPVQRSFSHSPCVPAEPIARSLFQYEQ